MRKFQSNFSIVIFRSKDIINMMYVLTLQKVYYMDLYETVVMMMMIVMVT